MSRVEYKYHKYPKKVCVRGANSPLGRDVFERPQTISSPSTDTTVAWKDQQSLKTLEDNMGKDRFNVGRSEPRKRKRVDKDPSELASQILGESSLNTKLEIPKKRFKSDTNETNLQDRLNVAKDQMPTEAPKKRKAERDLESNSAPNKRPKLQPVEAQVSTSKPKYYGKRHATLMKKVKESKDRERKLQDLFDLLESQKKDPSDLQAFLTVIRKVKGKIKTLKDEFWKSRIPGETLKCKAEDEEEGMSSMMDYEELPMKEVKLERKENKNERIMLVPIMQKSPSDRFPCVYVL